MQTARRRSTGSAVARLTALRAARVLVAVALASQAAPLTAQTPGRDTELSTPNAERHAEAVALARAGGHDRALEMLDALRAADPDNAALLYDETIVLGWAERDAEVLERIEALEGLGAPAFVSATVGKAARNLGRFELAAEWYERALDTDADHVDARLGLAMTYADQGRTAQAERELDALPDEASATAAARRARAYVEGRGGNHIDALRAYEAVLARAPNETAALRGKALALRSLLLPKRALELAEAHPGILSDVEIARLEADALALELRLATRTPYRPGRRAARLDATVAALETLLERDPPPSVATALRNDRIVALARARRSAEAIEAYEQREAETTPPYVLAAIGEAYMDAERPAEAVAALERAVALAPDALEHELTLIHAYLDLERPQRALEIALDLAERLPDTQSERGSTVVRGNDDWVRAQIAAALAEAYGDDLAGAQRRLEPLVAELPHNGDLRHELANVYHWRGWLDRSLYEYAQVLTTHPDLLAARVGHAHTLLDARRFGEFEQAVATLNETYAGEPGVEQLNERRALHDDAELRLSADAGDSSGATFGTEQRSFDATWLTSPIARRWRAFVHVHDAAAQFPEGDAQRRRGGVGIEYRDPRWIATAEVATGDGEAGLFARGERRLGDRWAVTGRVEIDSNDTQLRAERLGIESDLAGIGARFEPHESAALELGIDHRRLSDGNDATAAFVTGRRRVVNRPPWTLAVTGELSASRNARQDVGYFSPASDTSVLVGAAHEWRIFRRYERGVVQVVETQIGEYSQSGERDGRIWRLGYELRVDVSRRLSVTAGIERTRMFYDGAPEHGTAFRVGLNARF